MYCSMISLLVQMINYKVVNKETITFLRASRFYLFKVLCKVSLFNLFNYISATCTTCIQKCIIRNLYSY